MSKSEREKQILYINACMICIMAGYRLWGLYDQSHNQSDSAWMHHTHIQNLGKQYWWTYLQRRNGDADVGNGLVDTVAEGEARTNWENSIDVYTLTHSQSHSGVWLFETPWTAACQAPLSMGFPKQKYWSGLPFPSPGDVPNPGIKPESPALQADSLPFEPPRKPHVSS